MGFSDLIRERREAVGWSRRELARESGVPESTLRRIESGQTLGHKHMPRIMEALGISKRDLAEAIAG